MKLDLSKNWNILQDVHDTCEQLGLPEREDFMTLQGPQISEWEPLPELKHLQLLFSEHPYWGRELRYFNDAPWWYKKEFELALGAEEHIELCFTNVDYYCKVWLNGVYLGSHEGYSAPFSFSLDEAVQRNGKNRLIVKVWSPWDDEVAANRQERRTFLIYRNMVKGTYEHSDTFIQRDVNPVGIYGSVSLKIQKGAGFAENPEFSYQLDDTLENASLHLKVKIKNLETASLKWSITDCFTGAVVFLKNEDLVGTQSCNDPEPTVASLDGILSHVRLWNTWDKGTPFVYRVKVALCAKDGSVMESYEETTGFRKIEMHRTPEMTKFILNGKDFYMRGTAYFPDAYVSAMNEERYRRDLLQIKNSGFNMLRVHVHVDLPVFYELCDELGLGIMHDSEYNWMHPVDEAFADRFIHIYLETVDMLKKHPSLFCWICMNEPGNLTLNPTPDMDRADCDAMKVSPGPKLFAAVCEHDPSRPVIKGSFCVNDPDSGDSHNYTGSLDGADGHYSDIYGTTEKMNTEFGFDAPPCIDDLKKMPPVYRRLQPILENLDSIGQYQYYLLKYFIEHYRMQKYKPNAGYVQFLFNDMCPQTFYGIYDYWGLPKKGLQAVLESNMPIGIFLKFKDKLDAIYAVNDYSYPLGTCQVGYSITDEAGKVVAEDVKDIVITEDSLTKLWDFDGTIHSGNVYDVALWIEQDGKLLARNEYHDVFYMPEHIPGHPVHMSHETGCRIYWA